MNYDEHPYPWLSHAQTHPDRLATLATLFGMQPPPVERCRVLELGCASGFNLIPMAEQLPEATCIGIDSSARQVRDGQEAIATLGLQNITLHHMDIMDISPDVGQFDYIIAHGVYSWVPAPLQEKLLTICSQHLAPNGVAYISYNTYPGWHGMRMLRDMMRYHTRNTTDPHTIGSESLALLGFLNDAAPAANPAFGHFITSHITFLKEKMLIFSPDDPTFLLYDELATINEPLYFHQFIEQAARHGLQYLCESDLPSILPSNFPSEVATTLYDMADNVLEMEQYIDFLCSRSFRETLLCHADIPLQRTLKAAHLSHFAIAAEIRPTSPKPHDNSNQSEEFRGPDHATIVTDHPVSKAALWHLATIWPQAIPFSALLQIAREHVQSAAPQPAPHHLTPEQDETVLRANLFKGFCCSMKLIRLHHHAPQAAGVSDYSRSRPVARIQAQHSHIVTNLYHESVRLDTVHRHLVRALNGKRNRATLLEVLDGVTTDELDEYLQWLSQNALLV